MTTRNHITRPSHRADVNVTPMIDVMLVLLIIFMLVTPLIYSKSVLPRSVHAESRPEEPDEITLGIDRQGELFLRATGDAAPHELREPRAVTSGQLPALLSTLYRNRTKDRVLYLKADSGLGFGRIEWAIGAARRAGVRVIATVTEPLPTGSLSGIHRPDGHTSASTAP